MEKEIRKKKLKLIIRVEKEREVLDRVVSIAVAVAVESVN